MSTRFIDKVSIFCNIATMNGYDAAQFEDTAKRFKTLGHPMRLAIIEALFSRSYCVCELAELLGMHKSVTSKHLSALKQVGIIDMKREGTRVNCILTMPCVLEMMHCSIKPPNRGKE
ncbi:ArsR/SmtB family transcription factor [Sphaerochaeta sp.]|jgi:ArsR family transcriptional regulator|uniref:ArsR/SmtB family transcription factor n=1 Tax=Sphaerochaeta sp. TaxID=1972642 RepID=UPI003D1007F0